MKKNDFDPNIRRSIERMMEIARGNSEFQSKERNRNALAGEYIAKKRADMSDITAQWERDLAAAASGVVQGLVLMDVRRMEAEGKAAVREQERILDEQGKAYERQKEDIGRNVTQAQRR